MAERSSGYFPGDGVPIESGRFPDEYAPCAEIYDHIPLYRAKRDISFYVELARRSGGPVLELGCGTGRVSIPVARAGVPVVGLDLSAAMLEVFRRKLAAEPPEVAGRVRIIRGDMRRFRLEEKFPLITAPFRSFQHLLTVEDQKSCLRNVREHLADGGRLALDVLAPNIELLASQRVGETFEDADFVDPATGDRVIRAWRYVEIRRAEQINVVEFEYRRISTDGTARVESHRVPIRYFFRYELEHLLELCGFRIEEIFSECDRSPFDGRREIVAICRASG
ncbi:MAG: class I SAM-dependent methyltransferase [Planctomycetota bacterium]|nr:class I SAM-dependent methyltransferase [Planctomycetota bacterium]